MEIKSGDKNNYSVWIVGSGQDMLHECALGTATH